MEKVFKVIGYVIIWAWLIVAFIATMAQLVGIVTTIVFKMILRWI